MDPRIQKALILMENNLHKKQSFKQTAQSVNLSLWHLHHLFKEEMEISPAKYLKHIRMQRASHLLETGFLTVKEIMLKVGAQDESHFIRDFKKMYGVTPVRYRALFLAGKLTEDEQSTEVAKSANK